MKKSETRGSQPPKSNQQTKKLQKLQQQVDDLTVSLQQERADFTNFKKRSQTDKEQLLEYAKAEVITELLPLLDDLERALAHAPEKLADDPWAQGVSKVFAQAEQQLSRLGVTRIPAVGEPFNPELHEAIGFEDGDGAEEVIIEELRPGYMLAGTVLRPAMVRVGKSSNQAKQSNGGDNNE